MTALLHLTNNGYLNIHKGVTNLSVLLDLAKAFDTVSHNILVKKPELYGLKGVTLDWFSSYLLDRQQQCVVEGFDKLISSTGFNFRPFAVFNMISLDVFSIPRHTRMPMIPRYMCPLYPLLNYMPR